LSFNSKQRFAVSIPKRQIKKERMKKMNYQEFVGSVTGFLRETLPCGTELSLIPLEKNNGVILEGLSVRKEGERAAPAIYLDSYYQEYLGGRSMRQIQETILECCEDNCFSEHFDADFFADYRKVKPTVVYKLINYEKNQELLGKIPHVPFLNLAIVFYCLLPDTPVGNATVLIHNSHMKYWQITCGELYKDAKLNTPRLLPAEIKSMSEVLSELSGGLDGSREDGIPMYVLTNARKALGASCILYDSMLKHCEEYLGSSYYLLPSSVHEVILIPAEAVADSGELAAMVRDINQTQVLRTEVLSDQIYFYRPESGQLSIVKE
jgi:hypothetical protein